MRQNYMPRRQCRNAVAVAEADFAYTRNLSRLLGVFLLAAALLATALSSRGFALDSENIRIAKALSNAYAEVVDKVSPGVVGIETEKIVKQSRGFGFGDDDAMEFFERFFDMPGPGGPRRAPRPRPQETPERRQGGIGSGVVIDQDGHILTNNHVVADADTIKVEFATEKGKTYKAEVVGTDPNSDLAVIRLIDKPGAMPVVPLGDSDALQPGNIIIAIGSPLGYKNSVTAGVVSAKGRNLNELAYERFIQTDAAINPGNSGGPMVNLDGEVVGINTMISTRGGMGGSIGIGFAIPINQAKSVIKQLIETGSVTRGWLGIQMNPDDRDMSLELGHDGTGVLIADVDPSGPASKAGIRKGDVIATFDNIAIKDNEHLRYLVADTEPGRDVPVTAIRDGQKLELTVKIEPQPQDLYANAGRSRGGEEGLDSGQDEVSTSLGLTIRNLDDDTRKKYNIADSVASGVVVTEVDSAGPASDLGIRPGAIILEMNRLPVKDVAAFRKILKDLDGKSKVILYVRYGDVGRYMMLNVK